MKRVVDTSVAVKWFTIETHHEAAKMLIGEALVAPELIVAEVANVVWRKCQSNEIEREQALLAQSMVLSFIKTVPIAPLADAALRIAIDLGHPAYDCFFLALCESSGLRLITADARLLARCRGTRFEGLVEQLA